MTVLSTSDWILLAILVPALAVFYMIFVFVKQYRNAWLKMIVLFTYVAAIALTAVQILMVRFVPESSYQMVVIFNCAGQLIAATGILDSVQLLYGFAYMKTSKQTNMLFLKIWIGCAVIGLIPYPFAVVQFIPLLVYRIMSITAIAIETILYAVIIRKLQGQEKVEGALIYYSTTIVCRIGILIGIILRLRDASVIVVNVVHYTAVMVTACSMLMFTSIFHKAVRSVKSTFSKSMSSASAVVGLNSTCIHQKRISSYKMSMLKNAKEPSPRHTRKVEIAVSSMTDDLAENKLTLKKSCRAQLQ